MPHGARVRTALKTIGQDSGLNGKSENKEEQNGKMQRRTGRNGGWNRALRNRKSSPVIIKKINVNRTNCSFSNSRRFFCGCFVIIK